MLVMNLSAEQLSELLSMIGNSTPLRAADSRRAPRVSVSAKVAVSRCTPGGTEPPEPSTLRDASTRGFCLYHSRPYFNGDQFLLHLIDNDREIHMLCEVVHCCPLGERWSIGAEFICRIENPRPQDALTRQLSRIRQAVLG